MDIVVVGAGRIGSTIAFHLARAGHAVTIVARGSRLDQLIRDGAVVAVDGKRAPVKVESTLSPSSSFDLAVVTVLRHQLDELLPALQASTAKTVLLMFNTFDKLAPWRDALRAERFAFGFPNMRASLVEGRLRSVVNGPGMVTTTSSGYCAEVFQQAGLPAEVEHDMNSFLRSHVALVVPIMVAGLLTWQRSTQLTWKEATTLTGAMLEGLTLVRRLGHVLKPGYLSVIERLPSVLLTALLWSFARTDAVRSLGEFGPGEVRELIDAMVASAHDKTPKLQSIRP